jgi:hypothetical protein
LRLFVGLAGRQDVASVFDAFAVLSLAEGDPRLAARLLGAASALRDAAGAPLPPTDRAEVAECEAAVREALGESDYSAEWEIGRAADWRELADGILRGGARQP